MAKRIEFSPDMMKDIYESFRRVNNDELTLIAASEKYCVKYKDIKHKTFVNIYYCFEHMLDGTTITYDTGYNLKYYFLERIQKDYGSDIMKKSLDSLKKTIEHYVNIDGRSQNSNLKLYNYFSKQLLNTGKVEISEDLKNEISADKMYYEGDVEQIVINKYKRSKEARQSCIEKYGTTCSVCGCNFEDIYGEIGKGFIHVHHLIPISSVKQVKEIKAEDLRPVCPNCHAMLHKGNLSIEQLKEIIEKHKK
ncbi:MAG: HNH endonuclease [Prevotella sp.]|nr:HNH endonuclease [Prevotella sp.]